MKPSKRSDDISDMTCQDAWNRRDRWELLEKFLRSLTARYDSLSVDWIRYDVALGSFIRKKGIRYFGQLRRFGFRDDNLGLGKIKYGYLWEIGSYIRELDSFDPPADTEACIALAVDKINTRFSEPRQGLEEQYRDIMLLRFGAFSRDAESTLQAVGDKYGITRERVRQVVEAELIRMRLSGGVRLYQALDLIAKECVSTYRPLTADYIDSVIAREQKLFPVRFYLSIMANVASVPLALIDKIHNPASLPSSEGKRIRRLIVSLLPRDGSKRKVDAVYRDLRKLAPEISLAQFYATLIRSPKLSLDLESMMLNQAKRPYTITEAVFTLLDKSETPLSTAQMASEGPRVLGDMWPMRDPQSIRNALLREKDVYLLGAGIYGLDKHLRLEDWQRDAILNGFYDHLKALGKPSSASDFLAANPRLAAIETPFTMPYVVAALVRVDERFSLFGKRRLFGLSEWPDNRKDQLTLILEFLGDSVKTLEEISEYLSARRNVTLDSTEKSLERMIKRGLVLRVAGSGYRKATTS